MLTMLHATFPPSSLKKAIEVFMSPEIPKRPDYVREVASFTYGEEGGYHTYFILDVEESKAGDYLNHQTERNIYMESRIPGFNVAVRFGNSVPNGVSLAMRQLPK